MSPSEKSGAILQHAEQPGEARAGWGVDAHILALLLFFWQGNGVFPRGAKLTLLWQTVAGILTWRFKRERAALQTGEHRPPLSCPQQRTRSKGASPGPYREGSLLFNCPSPLDPRAASFRLLEEARAATIRGCSQNQHAAPTSVPFILGKTASSNSHSFTLPPPLVSGKRRQARAGAEWRYL